MKKHEQEGYDHPNASTGNTEASEHHVKLATQHNRFNGAGVSQRTIESSSPELHGGRSTTTSNTTSEKE